jgi:hypothetical protein
MSAEFDFHVSDEEFATWRAPRDRPAAKPPASMEPTPTPDPDWLQGTPMNPAAEPVEPMNTIPGYPIAHRGQGILIVGPTGGGRSSLVQAMAYDGALQGVSTLYLGDEVTGPEFNARAGDIARRRGDTIDDALICRLALVRYLPLGDTVAAAWADPDRWAREVSVYFSVVIKDPASSVGSALGLNFDNANDEWVLFWRRLVEPLRAAGVTVIVLDNVGHAEDARTRAKGASAKQDKADLTFHCKLQSNPAALTVTAAKVRPTRAAFKRGDSWLFDRDTMNIVPLTSTAIAAGTAKPFRPTTQMQRVSELLERQPGLSRKAIREFITGRNSGIDKALVALVDEGFVKRVEDGSAVRHESVKPYRVADDPDPENGGDNVDVVPTLSPGSSNGRAPLAPQWPRACPRPLRSDLVPRAYIQGHGARSRSSQRVRPEWGLLVSPATRMGAALLLADELRRAREDLEQFNSDVRLRRVEPDERWRQSQVDLIDELQAFVGRLTRFTRRETRA